MALIGKVQLACFPASAGRGAQTLVRVTAIEGLSALWKAEDSSQPAPRLLNCSPGIKSTKHVNQPFTFSHCVPVLRNHGSSLRLKQRSYIHTQSCGLLAAKDDKPADRRGSKGRETSGSVLMQFVEKKDEPKQLTVGGKGEWWKHIRGQGCCEDGVIKC